MVDWGWSSIKSSYAIMDWLASAAFEHDLAAMSAPIAAVSCNTSTGTVVCRTVVCRTHTVAEAAAPAATAAPAAAPSTTAPSIDNLKLEIAQAKCDLQKKEAGASKRPGAATAAAGQLKPGNTSKGAKKEDFATFLHGLAKGTVTGPKVSAKATGKADAEETAGKKKIGKGKKDAQEDIQEDKVGATQF